MPDAASPARPIIQTRRLTSPEATAAFASALADRLGAGDVLCLEGDLGAGKTHFARSLIRHLQTAHGALAEDVPSPSFTLVQTYEAGPLEIWHADLYRLSDPWEVDELGLSDAFDDALCLVEWPDRLGPDVPQRALWITLRMVPEAEDARDITLASHQPDRWIGKVPA
ncbi:tRNA (adenosine(37)-N6)-threonylcarbamoyltransferase complex ATPase subunit type 1 TsaE [Nioella nitratireducens]|uniref:tRNA (adenosine(37)-N6)-threonylcarbamoyltransferase complex ATPase subunit type 1 TsaE n=1 Tax=Nioella nitratireducens TaxID=1287720 RepID=UPI0008FD6DAD|nr:tRNA (adenosine(37)-N6)-threonylcarbamoyltransferase complex ATPase subunit type 1 TsaE [Nioella nitratireducens]